MSIQGSLRWFGAECFWDDDRPRSTTHDLDEDGYGRDTRGGRRGPAVASSLPPAPNPSPARACFGALTAEAITLIAKRYPTERRRIEPSECEMFGTKIGGGS